MKCDLENSFLLVYLSGPLMITHEPWGAALADPPLLVGLVQLIDGRTSKKENNMSLLEGV
jgi:predicted transcriptional regulator